MHERSIMLGLDVHKETIAVARAERSGGAPVSLGTIPNTPHAVAKLVRKQGAAAQLAACYEAGPCGYGLYRQLTNLGVECTVIAPSLVPKAPGDRVKTDRRDALHLAELHRSGLLSAVWVPDAAHEALRDLVRCREQARQDLQRARQRLSKFLLTQQLRPPDGATAWSKASFRWLDALQLEQPAQRAVLSEARRRLDQATQSQERLDAEIVDQMGASPLAALWQALQSMRGVSALTAAVLVAELGDCSRFAHPRQAMAYAGLTPSESSSGSRQQRGHITKTGNQGLRHVLVETAWHSLHPPAVKGALKVRQRGQPEAVTAIAWKAQSRLHRRYWRLVLKGKAKQVAIVSVARELVAFIWEIAQAMRALPATNDTPACAA